MISSLATGKANTEKCLYSLRSILNEPALRFKQAVKYRSTSLLYSSS